MRILLHECVPRPLRRELTGHDARTIREMGRAGKKNGELLALMTGAGFEVLLTVDQNLPYQRLADLVPLVPSALAPLGTIRPGDVVVVGP